MRVSRTPRACYTLQTPLACAGRVTQAEFDEIITCLGHNQARKCNLIPQRPCVTAIRSLGDGPKVRALITGLGQEVSTACSHTSQGSGRAPRLTSLICATTHAQLPRAWVLRDEQRANTENNEVDFLLEVRLAAVSVCATSFLMTPPARQDEIAAEDYMDELTEMAMNQELQTAYEPFRGAPKPQQKTGDATLSNLSSAA